MGNNPSKIKVVFVITKSNFGGAQRYVYELATGIPKNRFESAVVLGGDGLLVKKLSDAGIRTISLPSLLRDVNPIKDLASFITLFRLFKTERPDVVHLNSAKVSGLGAVAARLVGVPRIIFTAHGWAFNEDRSPLSRLIIKLLYFITILFSHKTIAVSEAVAKEAPAYGIRKKIVVIYPPVSQTSNILKKNAARKHFTEEVSSLHDDGRLWVGIVAELHKSKGIRYAIEAMHDAELQSKAILIILGEGHERPFLENMIHEMRLEKSVFLVGFRENAADLMPAFDVSLLPSTTEAFGYVVAEAGLAGLPVLASRIGGIPEIIEDGRTGLLIPARDKDAIKTGLLKLANSPSVRAALGAALHEKVASDFSPEKAVRATLTLYEKIER